MVDRYNRDIGWRKATGIVKYQGSKSQLTFALCCLLLVVAPNTLAAQDNASAPIKVEFYVEGEFVPDRVKGHDGARFEPTGGVFSGTVPRPSAQVTQYDLEVVYDEQSLPITIRVNKATEIVRIPIAIEKPPSCSNFHLQRRERPSTTVSTAIKQALTLGFMIDSRSGSNSCDYTAYRAAKARHDRYYNAMTYSDFLVIPSAIEDALLASAKKPTQLRRATADVERGRSQGRVRYAIVTQSNVTSALSNDEKLTQSILLQDALNDPEYSPDVQSVISAEVIERQVNDFQVRVDNQAAETNF